MRHLPTFHVKGEPTVLPDRAIRRQFHYFIYRTRMLALSYQTGEGNNRTRMEKTQHTFCYSICTFYLSSILFPYKLYTCTKVPCLNRRVFKTVTGSSVETQVCAAAGGTAGTQQWNVDSKPRSCAAKLFKLCSTIRNGSRWSLRPPGC